MATRSLDSIHRELGTLLWDKCGMARNKAGLEEALGKIPELRNEFWREVRVPGDGEDFNQSLERAGRVADFLEFAELMCIDALTRDESCGAHFREEHQTPEGEALRDDDNFAAVFAWEFQGCNGTITPPKLHREPLHFETVHYRTTQLAQLFKMNFQNSRVWRQKDRNRLASSSITTRLDIPPQASLLEMLDIVNERLLLRRRRTDRVRFRLSRRNLRHLLADGQRRSTRTRSSRRGLRTLHAKISRRRDDRDRAISGEMLSDR